MGGRIDLIVTRTEAIKRFLNHRTHADLAGLYNPNMEVQVNAAKDDGERITGEFKGRKWQGYSDGVQTWKSFRVPWKANSEPEYNDSKMSWDLDAHAEGIGLTGWDWKNKNSIFVAYDFDAIVGHSEKHLAKLTNEELAEVLDKLEQIPWVTTRRSTSGSGLHAYVFVEPTHTATHTEHAALSRAILGQMSALTGFNFKAKVDVCGGNMWIWHRKMVGTNGLEIIKQATEKCIPPPNWQDHIKVTKGVRRKNLPKNVKDVDTFEAMANQRPFVKLDDEHQRLLDFLEKQGALWWWDADHHALVTHTFHLQNAHEALSMRGLYQTDSRGTNTDEQNCFAFPLRNGAWCVRRFTQGVREHGSWDQDGAGWTRTYLNREPTLRQASKCYGGIEGEKGEFTFADAESAQKAAQALGVHVDVGLPMLGRPAVLMEHKGGRLKMTVEHKAGDDGAHMRGWGMTKNKKEWLHIFDKRISTQSELETRDYDDLVRHVVSVGEDLEDGGWLFKSCDRWVLENVSNIKLAFDSMGHSAAERNAILGGAVMKPWKIVNRPFEEEFPGDREWNRHAAQLSYLPSNTDELHYPHWSKILRHCGRGLDDYVAQDPWCQDAGILNGADYLKCWLACVIQDPYAPLPYLFFYGPQNTGKSSYHEAASLLLTKGYTFADRALTTTSDFNAEIEGQLICVVEETDLRQSKTAYNRIKNWVTARTLSIGKKYKTPYTVANTTHWIQCANDAKFCPVIPGDTRVVMVYVNELPEGELIGKTALFAKLEKEAPDFLAELLRLEIPECVDRLRMPALDTQDKTAVAEGNEEHTNEFLDYIIEPAPGQIIPFGELYRDYVSWCEENGIPVLSNKAFSKAIPPNIPKARHRSNARLHVADVWWIGKDTPETDIKRHIVQGKFLTPIR
jgi:hypothetical protein